MRSINKAVIMGNVGHSIEAKYSPSGTCIVNNTLATQHRKKDADGNWTDETCWHRFVAFGRTAELMAEYVQKGDLLHLEGRIHNDTYEGKDGTKKNKSEIIVSDMIMLGKRNFSDDKPAAQPAQPNQASKDLAAEFDDSIPF